MTRDTSKNFNEIVVGIAQRKLDAIAFRKSGKPSGVEESRDVYRNACQAIAARFELLGFKYRKTHPRFFRKDNLFEYRVTFQSSHHNIPGRHVQLWMHASVHSKTLLSWRESRVVANMRNDFVAGGMVHLLTEHAMVQWELADPVSRPSVIDDAVAFIQSVVLPFFDRFKDIRPLILDLSERTPSKAFQLRQSVELALCFGNQECGQRILDRFMSERPDLLDAIAEVERVGLRHPAIGPSNYAEQVVFMRQSYGLR
jgi:hypothetical protein